MTRHSPYVIRLSPAQRAVLGKRARSYTARHADVVRARIVLLCADGEPNTAIAERLDVHVNVVRTWRKRFLEAGLDGLADRPRTGRRPSAPSSAGVGAVDREPPPHQGAPRAWGNQAAVPDAVPDPGVPDPGVPDPGVLDPGGGVVVPVREPDGGRGAGRARRRRPSRPASTPTAPTGQLIHLHPRHGSAVAVDALRQLAATIDQYLAEVDAEHAHNRAGAPAPRGG